MDMKPINRVIRRTHSNTSDQRRCQKTSTPYEILAVALLVFIFFFIVREGGGSDGCALVESSWPVASASGCFSIILTGRLLADKTVAIVDRFFSFKL